MIDMKHMWTYTRMRKKKCCKNLKPWDTSKPGVAKYFFAKTCVTLLIYAIVKPGSLAVLFALEYNGTEADMLANLVSILGKVATVLGMIDYINLAYVADQLYP